MSGFGVSGFTFCRNAVSLGYPLGESIRSILPIVDEFVVALAPSDDGTGDLIEKIGSPKIRIVETAWDDSVTTDARVLSAQATFALSRCRFPWAFHLQADEVIHEEDLPRLQGLMREHAENREMPQPPCDIVDQYVFLSKQHRWPENAVGKPQRLERRLQLGLAPKIG